MIVPEPPIQEADRAPRRRFGHARVLIVDDDDLLARLFRAILGGEGHACTVAGSVEAARLRLGECAFELVLCDVNLGGDSGLDLARWICERYPETSVVMVSGRDEPEIWSAALDLGAVGYLTKPIQRSALLIAVANTLHRRQLEAELRRHREELEETVKERTAELERARADVELTYEETVRRLALAAEFRDRETGDHVERMGRLCALLAGALGLPADACERLRLASLLHDVGKIGIPDAILGKPGPLTAEEWDVIRRHPEMGHRLLGGSRSALLDLAATVAYTHHERLDGSGYPRGLAGDEIPLAGRIAAVADVLDALTSPRVYKVAQPFEHALATLEEGRGTLYDPDVLDALQREIVRVRAVLGDPRRMPAVRG
ncbi:Response regulator containing a CheY-like receiver domain and an HD-GYP domain [Gaiella occulta]|uniref:Response regulator containing a CheY-like receiver domain and an HD-GYP domain n=1 Tax=Gaiella occulta TaxID=1002870 RepID=A0A7M2YVQ8_9ACTN|nr:HD domain-containing phosphohydrolase [Gaiella occulta]RDI73508.1 Response regulator containing a CheY-like receiver domain and an HD-GYP domain [Gaiella occulta]